MGWRVVLLNLMPMFSFDLGGENFSHGFSRTRTDFLLVVNV